MTKPKLTYFDMAASRGEDCRLALVLAGVDFEDHRLTREQWMALKPSTPFGSLPIFEVEGKPVLAQANAILTYLGLKYDLLPSDEWERARALALMGAVEDCRVAVGKTFGIKDEAELKAARQTLVEGPLTSWGKSTEAQITGPFACGEAISVADLKIFVNVGWIEKGVLDHVPVKTFQGFAKLQALVQAVRETPAVKAWYSR